MRIVAYPNFQHAGHLWGSFDSRDPRREAFNERSVEVDLRRCDFVRPPAVLWCTVYPLLAKQRGCDCTLLVPENTQVCMYLKSAGLFQTLQEKGVEVDDRDISPSQATQLVLPLTRFDTQADVEQISNDILEALEGSGLGAANLYPFVSATFDELALNAVQHSESPVGAYGIVQFYESEAGRRFVCGVADGGIGIRRSLEKNPIYRERVPYDWVAVELAAREGVTSVLDKNRGIGLNWISEEMRKVGRQLIIHSGIGSLQISEDIQTGARRTRLFPGTLGYASIPC